MPDHPSPVSTPRPDRLPRDLQALARAVRDALRAAARQKGERLG